MKLATAEQMRRLDAAAIQGRGIPSLTLMERAAQGLLAAAEELAAGTEKRAAVFAGPGNNGGDGVAVAGLMLRAGWRVRCFLAGKRERMSPDCRAMEERLIGLGGVLEDYDPADPDQKAWAMEADVIVDALFGVGLNAPLRQPAAAAVERINASPARVVSADIPSGVETDTGRILGDAVRADVTVTFSMAKPGHFAAQGRLCAGRLIVHDIGIPADLLAGEAYTATAVDRALVSSWLPERPEDGHKGDFGRVYVLAGSVGYTGAPVLASRAAVRSGCGLVFLGVPEPIYPIAAVKSDEAMPHPLPAGEDGMLSREALAPALTRMAGCDAALIGPGLGRGQGVEEAVCAILSTVNYPLVVDADGLNALSRHMDILDGRRDCPTILTPHDGEFARLGGDLSHGDRIRAAREFAEEHGCLLVLKGHCTVVALPDGEVFLNTTGSSGMAKGGSGDVLAGILLSLLGQGMHPVKAAAAAVWAHGRAGDLCAGRLGKRGMAPSDLIEALPQVWQELEQA